MAATPSIRVVKSIPFKGGTKLTSNRYHFNGGTPSGSGPWTTFMDNVVAAEKAIFTNNSTIVECIGYAAGSDVPVFSKTYSQQGTGTFSGNSVPGECAGLLRWSTTARTSKNHPVYLFNYFHKLISKAVTGQEDLLVATQRTAIDTYAAAWISGFSDGSHTLVRAGPNGATAVGSFTEEYFTHRDFPYSRSA